MYINMVKETCGDKQKYVSSPFLISLGQGTRCVDVRLDMRGTRKELNICDNCVCSVGLADIHDIVKYAAMRPYEASITFLWTVDHVTQGGSHI
jgi:hypothetical protein